MSRIILWTFLVLEVLSLPILTGKGSYLGESEYDNYYILPAA